MKICHIYFETLTILKNQLFFNMASFGLHHGLETPKGGAARSTHLLLRDAVP